MSTGNDDDDDGGRHHGRRGPRRGFESSRDGFSGHEPPPTPGKATLAERLPPAHPAAVAPNAVRSAVGGAARIRAMAAPLATAISAADYLASGRLSFEIRASLRRAETALAGVERDEHAATMQADIASARAQLAALDRELGFLLRAAPVLEQAGAGSEQAERAWKLRHGETPATANEPAAPPAAGVESSPRQLEQAVIAAGRAGKVAGDRWQSMQQLAHLASPSPEAAGSTARWTTDAAPIASELGLGTVEIKTDATARAVTDAQRARGVALNDAVHMHPDRVQPGTLEGREVLAHELVHLAQARLPAEHDAGRGAAEHEAADIARSIARGGPARRPTYHIDLSRPAADSHAKVQVSSGTVDARGYINRTGNAVRINEAIIAEIDAMVLPGPPAPRLAWKDSAPFRSQLRPVLAKVLGRAAKAGDLATRLVELTYPTSVLEALDGIRAKNKEQPVAGRVLGPDTWQDAAGRAIADTVAAAIAESLIRMGAQYVTTADDADRRRAEDGWESAYVLVPSHPMDEHVAPALLGDDQGRSVLSVAPAEKARHRTAKNHRAKPSVVPRGWRAITIHWQGERDPTLWNWLVADPADATVEEVSAALYDGDTSHAAWLTAAPPYFALHPAHAREIPGAVEKRPAEATTVAADAEDVQSLGALTATTAGDTAALAQGAHVALKHRAAKDARAEAEAALADTGKQLAYLTDVLTAWGLVHELYPAFNFELRCQTALATATGGDATAWAKVAVGQQQNLFEIAGAVATLAQAVATPEPAGTYAGPIFDLLADYARAAGSAHLAETGRALIARAQHRQARLASDAATRSVHVSGAVVDDARAATEASDQAAAGRDQDQDKAIAAAPGMWRSTVASVLAAENKGDLSRPEMRQGRDELTRGRDALDAQVRQIRADAIAGNPTDPDVVDEVMLRSDELTFAAQVRAIRLQVRELERAAHAVDKGLLSKVVDALDGKISGVQDFAAIVRAELDQASAMLHITGATAALDLSAAELRDKRREALTAAQGRLEALGGMPLVVTFLRVAEKVITDHQFRVALLNFAVMVGVGFGAAAAGAWVARAVGGTGAARATLGFLANVGTEATINTTAGAALNGQSAGWRELIENFLSGAGSRLIMHPFTSGASAARTIEPFALNVWKRHGARLVLDKTLEVSADGIINLATGYAAHFATHSHQPPTQKSVDEWMIDGLGIAVGRFVHGRVSRMQKRTAGLSGEAAAQLRADAKALARASALLEAHPDPEHARALLDQAQMLANREHALLQAQAASATGATRDQASAAYRAAQADAASGAADIAGLAVGFGGFREVVPGTVFEGSPEAITRLAEKADAYGIEVVGYDPPIGRWTFRHGQRVIHIDEVAGTSNAATIGRASRHGTGKPHTAGTGSIDDHTQGIPEGVPANKAEVRGAVAAKYRNVVAKYENAGHVASDEYLPLLEELRALKPGELADDPGRSRELLNEWIAVSKRVEATTGRSAADLRALYNQVEQTDFPVWMASMEHLPDSQRAAMSHMYREELRLYVRDLMTDANSKEILYLRDLALYGRRNGPDLDYLVKKAIEKGKTADEAYSDIVSSSQRSNPDVNRAITGSPSGIPNASAPPAVTSSPSEDKP